MEIGNKKNETRGERKRIKILISSVFLISFFVFPVFVHADNPTPGSTASLFPCSGVNDVSDPNLDNGHECTFDDLITASQGVAAKIVQIGLIIAPLIFAYAGFLLVTSQDKPAKRDEAKKIAWNVAKGLAIMMLAWVFVNLILTALLKGNVLDALPWAKK